MPDQDAQDLKKCLKDAKGDAAKKTACESAYKTATGATAQGGKVFEKPDGTATFSTTDGGKVFIGTPV